MVEHIAFPGVILAHKMHQKSVVVTAGDVPVQYCIVQTPFGPFGTCAFTCIPAVYLIFNYPYKDIEGMCTPAAEETYAVVIVEPGAYICDPFRAVRLQEQDRSTGQNQNPQAPELHYKPVRLHQDPMATIHPLVLSHLLLHRV